MGAWSPVPAEETPVPESCKLHPVHVVNSGCVPALTSELREPGITLPDLVPDSGSLLVERPFTWDEATQTFRQGPPHLWFETRPQNLGAVSLDVAADDPRNPATSEVSQCVSWTAEYVCRGRQQIRGLVWDEEDNRFHDQDFTSYQFRRLSGDGRPDYSETGLISSSAYTVFCLVDHSRADPEALPAPTYQKPCLPDRQGISSGWTDSYALNLPEQQFSLEGLTDGRYALVIALDTADRIYESNDANNVVEVTIELSNNLSEVRVVDKRWP